MQPSTLYSQATIANQVAWLGRTIADRIPSGSLVMIGVLKGAFIFMSDLVRAVPRDVTCDFVSVSSYGDGKTSLGEPTLHRDLSTDLRGQHVVLVEDIVDTGITARFLLDRFAALAPSSLYLCALLDKPSRRAVPIPAILTALSMEE